MDKSPIEKVLNNIDVTKTYYYKVVHKIIERLYVHHGMPLALASQFISKLFDKYNEGSNISWQEYEDNKEMYDCLTVGLADLFCQEYYKIKKDDELKLLSDNVIIYLIIEAINDYV